MITRTVFFDRSRKSGRWLTVTKGSVVVYGEHKTEREARRFIGLDGGSQDPDYRPPKGETGGETVQDGSG